MKLKTKLLAGLMLLSGAGFSASAMAGCPGAIGLPDPTTTAISFGDGLSYSLPILGLSQPSSPGQIDDCIVVLTGSSGQNITTNLPGMDNAYAAPSGTGGSPWFQTGTAVSPDPGGTSQFTGDTGTTWDTTTAALKSFLGSNDMVFYFNHNQTNSGGSLDQSLAIWVQIRLWTPDCPTCTTGTSQYFYLTATSGALSPNFGQFGDTTSAFTGPQTAATCNYPSGADCLTSTGQFPTGGLLTTGSPVGAPTDQTARYFVFAQGQICLGGDGSAGSPIVPCDGSGGTVAATFNENLGANEVANAVVFPEVNALLAAGTYTNMSIDLRYGCNPGTITNPNPLCPTGFAANNGYEQLFIGQLTPGVCVPTPANNNCGLVLLPEPDTLALFGLGLFAVMGLARRRKI